MNRIVKVMLGCGMLIALFLSVAGAQEPDEATVPSKYDAARGAIRRRFSGYNSYGLEIRCAARHIRIDREDADVDDSRRKADHHAADLECEADADALKKREAEEGAAIHVVDEQEAVDRKEREARETQGAALADIASKKLEEQHQRELKRLRVNCSAVYLRTVDKKVSDLTVRETQFVQACQGMGMYPPK